MSTSSISSKGRETATGESAVDRMSLDIEPSRRQFLQALGAGLMIAINVPIVSAQVAPRGGRRGGGGGFRGGGAKTVAARVHIGKDGTITVMTSKVECGQGARAEITQAAAEELRVPLAAIRLIMADTSQVPDDGMTAGSGTTPRTIPSVRQGCAAARMLLTQLAGKRWNVDHSTLAVEGAKVIDHAGGRELSYADLASAEDATELFAKPAPTDVTITPIKEWKILGVGAPRPNGKDLVTGGHHYPSDVTRPGMLHGKILRAPRQGAGLSSIDLARAKAMKNVTVVQDGAFVGVAAPTTYAAEEALDALAASAKWDESKAASLNSDALYDHLRQHARGGMPANPFADEVAKAAKSLKQTYLVPYVQHAPMEPRAAVAEWNNGNLTVWTATQNPFGVRGELVRAFKLADDKVRVIVPDFGGGFGGKHSGECAVECARLAQAAGKPVALCWTRAEEFTFAYFRPAAVIDVQASLDASGNLTSWHFINVNSGPSSIETPYRAGKAKSQFLQSEAPLRHGSYRGLAATANTFGRECFMDELATLAGRDPLEFRVSHLSGNDRLRAVLEEAAKRFDWTSRLKNKRQGIGVGLACGAEKGSFVATCAEVSLEGDHFKVTHVVQAFECGTVINPLNLTAQNTGSIVMALGPAMREEIRFHEGQVSTDSFSEYLVPRLADVPQIEVHLIDRRDLPSSGAGETPLIAVAPAIANALFQATGTRLRQMPLRLSTTHA